MKEGKRGGDNDVTIIEIGVFLQRNSLCILHVVTYYGTFFVLMSGGADRIETPLTMDYAEAADSDHEDSIVLVREQSMILINGCVTDSSLFNS